jgi:hypothetical protein
MFLFLKRGQSPGAKAGRLAVRRAAAKGSLPAGRGGAQQDRDGPDHGARLVDLVPDLGAAQLRGDVVELLYPGAELPAENDGIASTIAVMIDPQRPESALGTLPGGRKFILMRNWLHLVRDYRAALRAAFERLGVGGWLVITVPHQFLAERKFRLPSRHGSKALRFYTPASLLAEIEEAIDSTEYRVRILKDDDQGFDYHASIHDRPEGNQRIVLGIQRIARPSWADHLFDGDNGRVPRGSVAPVREPDAGPSSTYVLGSVRSSIEAILVIKLDHRGDYLMAVPALRQLRAHFPKAQITFVCGSWNAGAARDSGLFDAVLPLDFFAEDASTRREPKRDVVEQQFADMMRGKAFDLAMDLRYYDDTRNLLKSVNARHKAGFDSWNAFPWLDIKLNLPSPTLRGNAARYHWSADRFRCAEQDRGEGFISGVRQFRPGPTRAVVWGPYAELSPGTYHARMRFDLRRGGTVKFDIVCDEAQTALFRGTVRINPQGEAVFDFELERHVRDVEVRIFAPNISNRSFLFRDMELERAGAMVGVHQRESMQLLVELAAMRLYLPYTREIEESLGA